MILGELGGLGTGEAILNPPVPGAARGGAHELPWTPFYKLKIAYEVRISIFSCTKILP